MAERLHSWGPQRGFRQGHHILKFQENYVCTSKSIDFKGSVFTRACMHTYTCKIPHIQEKDSTRWSKKEIRACVEELEFLGYFMYISGGALQKLVSFFGLWIGIIFMSSSSELRDPELLMLLLPHFHFVFDCNCFYVLVTPKSLTIFPGPLEWNSLVIYFIMLIFLG